MGDVIDRIAMIREATDNARSVITRLCIDSRERSLALTKLDEARLWGIEAVTSSEANHTPR